MWEYINLIFLAIEIIAVIVLFVVNSKSKSKKFSRILYIIVVFLINFMVFFLPKIKDAIENGGSSILPNIAKGIAYAIGKFAFKIDLEPVEGYVAMYPLYTLNYLVGAIMALVTTVITTLSLFSKNQGNKKKVSHLLKNGCDLVLSNSKDALKYASNSSSCVVWVNEDTASDVMNNLIASGYNVLKKEFNLDTLKSNLFKTDKNYNIISFEDSSASEIEIIKTMITYFKETNNFNIKLQVEVKVSETEAIKQHIVIPSNYAGNITLFNKNELLSLEFIENEPVAKHLPLDYINDNATIDENKEINVFVLGYDDLNKELIRQYVMNNQLVTVKKGKLSCFKINYHIFDDNYNMEHNSLRSYKHKISKLSKKDYFALPDEIANIEFHPKDLDCDELLDDIVSLTNKDAYNYFFISLGHESKNIAFAKEVSLKLKENTFHIYCRSTSKDFVKEINYISYYGNYEDVLSHDVIVDDTLSSLAVACNNVYNEKSNDQVLNEWHSLSYIAVKSNIYSAANIRLKLNLLKIDYTDKNVDKKLEKSDFDKIYLKNSEHKSYKDYFKINARNVLIYQEHLRWNAFYLLLGWLPLKKDKVVYQENKKIFRKDEDYKLHVYITTFEGIDKVLKHLIELYKTNENEIKTLEDVEVYKYDADTLEICYDVLSKLKYNLYQK